MQASIVDDDDEVVVEDVVVAVAAGSFRTTSEVSSSSYARSELPWDSLRADLLSLSEKPRLRRLVTASLNGSSNAEPL